MIPLMRAVIIPALVLLSGRGSAVISAWKSGNLLVVTHGSNIAAFSGLQLAAAEILVVEPGAIPPRVVGRISPPR